MKHCPRCGARKPRDEFGRDASRPDGRFSYCKRCASDHQRKLQEPAQARRAKRERVLHLHHVEHGRLFAAKRCPACATWQPCMDFYPNKSKAGGLSGYCKRCDVHRVLAGGGPARWKKANPEKVKAGAHQYHRRYPGRFRAQGLARRARIRGAFVEHVDALVLLERDDGVCGICLEDVDPFDFHVDHIVPLARGGEHSYANTQAAHPTCNRRKGAKEVSAP